VIDDPNVIFPLATSYNERGVAGYTHVVSNGEDQRKVNCIYELSKNPMTGKGTLTLSKRPGVTINSNSFGSSSQTSYLIADMTQQIIDGTEWNVVISKTSSNVVQSSTHAATWNITTAGPGFFPTFIDVTRISNVKNVVVQLVDSGVTTSHVVYYINFSDLTAANPWTQISDGDFAQGHIGKMEHLDGFAFLMTVNNIIFNSDSNSLQSWNAASFITKQIRQDSAVGLARLSNKILAFGVETVEAFYNAGNTVGSPLGRIPQLHSRVGLVSSVIGAPTNPGGVSYYCNIEQKLYFVGRYSAGSGCGLFVFDGQNFIKVSSQYIDKILSEKSGSIYSVSTVNVGGTPMVAICFTASGVSPQISLMYSPSWNEWFDWNSTVFSPVNQGQYFLGLGSNQHKLYSFAASDNWQDDGTSYQFLTQFRLPSNGSSKKSMLMYGIDADTDTSSNTISVDVSDDDCQSFYGLQSIDLTRERKVNFRGGSYTRRHVRLSATDARPKRIANFIARVE
jgi:hypothetical protein